MDKRYFLALFALLLALLYIFLDKSPITNRRVFANFRKNRKILLNCSAVFDGDPIATREAAMWKPEKIYDKLELLKLTEDCDQLKRTFSFANASFSKEEEQFPLAFVILAHRNLEQIIRLFETFYWPQNYYCIAYDLKSDFYFRNGIENFAKCFPNIIFPHQQLEIYWGHFSVLQAAVNCLQALYSHSETWRYVQILTWSDIPLKTNAQMVQIFKVLNGSNDAELNHIKKVRYSHPSYFVPHGGLIERSWRKFYQEANFAGHWLIDLNTKRTPPANLTIYKGSFGASLTREFVGFALEDSVAQELFEWSNLTFIPDEFFWSTLVHNENLGAPGSFPGRCLSDFDSRGSSKPFISRYDVWSRFNCGGTIARSSCIFGVRDLKKLRNLNYVTAHKVYLEFQPATFYCLMESIREQTFENETFDLNYYVNLPVVKYRELKSDLQSTYPCE